MGEIESKSKKRAKRVRLENIIFGALAVAGVTAVAAAAPNTLQLLKYADPDWMIKRDPRRRLRETLSRMKRKGLIAFELRNGGNFPRLTAAGLAEARRLSLGMYAIKIPLRWDKKWRVVIFDIPEKKKHMRDHVRRLVAGLGFYRLQDSVWAYPYDCEDVITILKLNLKIGSELLYMIVDAIEYDRPLRVYFDLPPET